MARENTIFMYGRIMEKPLIKINSNGEFIVARIKLLTVRRSKANEELKLLGTPRLDIQYIITRNPKIIEKRISPLREGDMVLVKGNFSTRDVKKKHVCPHCGTVNLYEGAVMIYIDPVFIEKMQNDTMTEEEARDKLLSKAEISNCAFISGTLCRNPEYYKSLDNRKEECSFQLAVSRSRRIIEDGPDKSVDYPYVKAYGKKTYEYSQVLHTGSQVFINGAIQAREITMMKECGECGLEFEALGATMEIVPYTIEYLNNCNIPHEEDGTDNSYTDKVESSLEDKYEESSEDFYQDNNNIQSYYEDEPENKYVGEYGEDESSNDDLAAIYEEFYNEEVNEEE